MKHLKQNIHRLVATMLLVCFCLSASSTVYAADPADWEEQLASFNKQLGAWGGSRDVSKNTWGYKIQLYSATKNINFDSGTSPNKVGNGYCVKTIFALNTVGNPNVTYQAPAADQFRWAPLKLVTDMGALAIPEGKIEIVVWGGAAGTSHADVLRTKGAGPICEILGSPLAGGLDGKLVDGFNASEPFMKALLGACTINGDASVLAQDVYSRIEDVDLKQEIASKIPGGEVNDNFDVLIQKYVLPSSPECMISWAAYVTPLAHTKLKPGAEANAMISDVFNDYMGTAHDYAYVNGATRAAATQLIETRDEIAKIHELDNTTYGGAGAATAVTQIEQSAIVKAVDANRDIIKEMADKGEFGYQLYDVMYCALPNSVYNTKEMWGIPIGKPAVGYDDVGTAFGSGIGLLWQDKQHAIKKIEPCCRPRNWAGEYPTAYCPCGGPGSPRCTCGCNCHPGHPCDCNPEIPEPVPENPLIDERHLIQQLEHEFPANAGAPNVINGITYQPIPPNMPEGNYLVTEPCAHAEGHQEKNTPYSWHTCVYEPLAWKEDYKEFVATIPSDSYTLYSKMVNDPGSTGSKFALMQMDDKPLLRFYNGGAANPKHFAEEIKSNGKITTGLGTMYQTALTARWLSHRWAIPGSENTAILAKYMAGTKNNQTYKEFMQKSGSSPVAEDNSYKNYNIPRTAKAPRFDMAFHIGDDAPYADPPSTGNPKQCVTYTPTWGARVTSTQEAHGASDTPALPPPITTHATPDMHGVAERAGIAPITFENAIQSAILSKYEYKVPVDVQQMYYGKTQAPNLGNYKVLTGNGPTSAHLESPSAVISFYPTYRMYADYNPDEPSPKGINEGNPVDMLGHIKRSFRYKEVLDVTCSFGGANVVAPWSRDQEDISTRTMKAGNAYKYSQGAVNIAVEGTFYLLDPEFSDNPKQQQINDAIVKQHENQIKAIGAGFSSGNIQLTSELYNSTAFSEKKPGSTGKEAIALESKDGYYSPPSVGRANLAGNEGDAFSKSPAGASVGGPENNALKLNLATGGGNKVQGWYNEDFEGIQKVTMTANFGVGPLSASYSSVHPHQSDWQTKSKHYSISPIITVGSASWGAASIDNIQFHPGGAQFNVRGSVFDTVN